jgi:hypothetical protein
MKYLLTNIFLILLHQLAYTQDDFFITFEKSYQSKLSDFGISFDLIQNKPIKIKKIERNINSNSVTCFHIDFTTQYGKSFDYIPEKKKKNGAVISSFGKDTLLTIYGNNIYVGNNQKDSNLIYNLNGNLIQSYSNFKYNGNSIHEFINKDSTVKIANCSENMDPALISVVLFLELQDKLIQLNEIESIKKKSLDDFLKEERKNLESSCLSSLEYFQSTNFQNWLTSLDVNDRDKLLGNGYYSNGYSRRKIDIETIIKKNKEILKIFSLYKDTSWWFNSGSWNDLTLTMKYISLKTDLLYDVKSFKENKKEIQYIQDRRKWNESNKFEHNILVEYNVKEHECALCHQTCSTFSDLNFTNTELKNYKESDFYNELYINFQNNINLNLKSRYGCKFNQICSESITGKSKHAWKVISEKSLSEKNVLKNL